MAQNEPLVIAATEQDYQQLLAKNPLAREQLKSIILARLLGEAQETIGKLNGKTDEPVPKETVEA